MVATFRFFFGASARAGDRHAAWVCGDFSKDERRRWPAVSNIWARSYKDPRLYFLYFLYFWHKEKQRKREIGRKGAVDGSLVLMGNRDRNSINAQLRANPPLA